MRDRLKRWRWTCLMGLVVGAASGGGLPVSAAGAVQFNAPIVCTAFTLSYYEPPFQQSFPVTFTGVCSSGTLTDLAATGSGTLTMPNSGIPTVVENQLSLVVTLHNTVLGGSDQFALNFTAIAVKDFLVVPPVAVPPVPDPSTLFWDTGVIISNFSATLSTTPIGAGLWQEECNVDTAGNRTCNTTGMLVQV